MRPTPSPRVGVDMNSRFYRMLLPFAIQLYLLGSTVV